MLIGGSREGKSTLDKLFSGKYKLYPELNGKKVRIDSKDNEKDIMPKIGHNNNQSETLRLFQTLV